MDLPVYHKLKQVLAISFLLGMTGCATKYYEPKSVSKPIGTQVRVIRPVIAVTDFENKSDFSGKWQLGTGMADVLINQLLDTGEAVVLERQNIGDVLSEINLQGSEMFRKEGKVTHGRLKTARYLIRGAVTDFTVTRDLSGWFTASSSSGIFARGQKARVTLHAMLIDVENGEVIGSMKSTGDAGSGLFGGRYDYKDMNFGGEMFFKTPLGKATEEAMGKIVRGILRSVPKDYWRPVVAEADAISAVLNGGRNVGMKKDTQFQIMERERTITDPLTGDIIERRKGRIKGRLIITEVLETSSHGKIFEGSAERGDWLEPIVFQ